MAQGEMTEKDWDERLRAIHPRMIWRATTGGWRVGASSWSDNYYGDAKWKAAHDLVDERNALPTTDAVVKPSHYVVALKDGRELQCREVIRALDLPFALANVLKYLWRAGRKTPDRLTDLRKAAAYLADEINALECSQS